MCVCVCVCLIFAIREGALTPHTCHMNQTMSTKTDKFVVVLCQHSVKRTSHFQIVCYKKVPKGKVSQKKVCATYTKKLWSTHSLFQRNSWSPISTIKCWKQGCDKWSLPQHLDSEWQAGQNWQIHDFAYRLKCVHDQQSFVNGLHSWDYIDGVSDLLLQMPCIIETIIMCYKGYCGYSCKVNSFVCAGLPHNHWQKSYIARGKIKTYWMCISESLFSSFLPSVSHPLVTSHWGRVFLLYLGNLYCHHHFQTQG
jgi:hypothetical protein